MEFIPLSPRVDDGNSGREDAGRDQDSPLPPRPKLASASCGGLGMIFYDPKDFSLGLPIEPRSGQYKGVVLAEGKTRIYPDKEGVATADASIVIDPAILPKRYSVPFEMADGRIVMVTVRADLASDMQSDPAPGWAFVSIGALGLALKLEA